MDGKIWDSLESLRATGTVPLLALLLIFSSCSLDRRDRADTMAGTDWEDALPVIPAAYETFSEHVTVGEDAMDDPAIWIHPKDPSRSLIIGTNKRAGISTYTLKGREVQFIPAGRPTNVDVRYGFRSGENARVDLLGYTEREKNEIVIKAIREDGRIIDIMGGNIRSDLSEVYGFCFYHSPLTGRYYAIANDKEGNVEYWQLRSAGAMMTVEKARTLKLKSQIEGMVADDEAGYLYVGEENRGVWRFPAEPGEGEEGVLLEMSGIDNDKIEFDIEGLAIYKMDGGKGYLLVSSQGNNSFAVFDRIVNNKYIGSFRIGGNGFDDTRDTDGIEAVSLPLGNEFPKGVLVVQDGINYTDDKLVGQNFKIVDFRKVLEIIE